MNLEAILTAHTMQLRVKEQNLTEAEKFRALALQMLEAQYVWGKENLYGSDCSGTVCLPLMLLGYAIRTTADQLYRLVFTDPVREKDKRDFSKIIAVFYLTKERVADTRRSMELPKGYARHVTPVVGEWVVLEANYRRDRVVLRTSRAVNLEYKRRMNCRAVWRALNKERAQELSDSRSEFHDVDSELIEGS